MKRTPLKPGAKSLARGSTFKARTTKLRDVSERMRKRRAVQRNTKVTGRCQLAEYVYWAHFAAGLHGDEQARDNLMVAIQCCAGQAQGRRHRRKASAGGADTAENLMLACSSCNDTVEDYPQWMRAASEHL